MKASFDKAKLFSVLTLLKATVAGPKSDIPALTHVCFDGEWAFTYSGTHMSRVRFESPVTTSAPLATLLSLVSLAKGSTVSITVKSTSEQEWRCGRNAARLEVIPKSAWLLTMDLFAEFTQLEESDDNRALATAMRAVIPRVAEVAAGDDDVRTPGIKVRVTPKRVIACATDNLRAGVAYVPGAFSKSEPFVISESFTKILRAAPVDGLQCYQSENWCGFRFADGYEIFTRTLGMPSDVDYGTAILSKTVLPAHKIVVDEAFVSAVKSINDLGDRVMLTIQTEGGNVFLFGKSTKPARELDLQAGVVMPASADVTDAPDDVSATMLTSHANKLCHIDA